MLMTSVLCDLWLRIRRRTGRSERGRGAVLVEAAIAIPILVMVITGAVTTGLAYNTNNSLNNGARESARFGATLAVDSSMSAWLNQVADAAIGATEGNLGPAVPGQSICVAYVFPDGSGATDSTTSLVETAGDRVITTGGTCFTDSRPDGERRVQVLLSRTSDIETIAYKRTLTLQSASLMRFERGD